MTNYTTWNENNYKRIVTFNEILDTVWVIICVVMVLLAQVGFMMKETGSIKIKHNTVILLKTILVIGVSSLTFFIVGFGFSIKAGGGVFGQDNFLGMNYTYSDYTRFIYYLSLCVMMATIATCSLAERTSTDTYLFFSFVTSGFIFPIGLAWCWNDGWLQNQGFIDYGGASIVHIMGGLAGFIGTYLIGPRVGLFSPDNRLAFIMEDTLLDDEIQDIELYDNQNQQFEQELQARKMKKEETIVKQKQNVHMLHKHETDSADNIYYNRINSLPEKSPSKYDQISIPELSKTKSHIITESDPSFLLMGDTNSKGSKDSASDIQHKTDTIDKEDNTLTNKFMNMSILSIPPKETNMNNELYSKFQSKEKINMLEYKKEELLKLNKLIEDTKKEVERNKLLEESIVTSEKFYLARFKKHQTR